MNKKLVQEAPQDFINKIPTSLKIKGDEIVKDILTKGQSGAVDYSFIDDSGRTITPDSAQKAIDKITQNLPENPTEEELKEADTQIAVIQNRLAGNQNTPKSDSYDYIAEKLIQIYALPDGDMTSLGFPVTAQMKTNIIQGLTKMFDMYDRAGVFKSFFIGGKNSSRYGNTRPKLPRKKDGSVNWEFFDTLFLLTRNKVSDEAQIQKLVSYYIAQGMKGSFSSLFMKNASLRYFDAFRETQSKKYKKDGTELSPDTALRYDPTGSAGDQSLSDPLGGDGSGTLGDTIADRGVEIDSSVDTSALFSDLTDWIRTNRSESDAQAFTGLFTYGMKPKDIVADPRFPLVTDQKEITNMLTALKAGKFQRVMRDLVNKHMPHVDTNDMNIKNLSSKIYSARAEDERNTNGEEDAGRALTPAEMDKYYATGELPKDWGGDAEVDSNEPQMVSMDDLEGDEYDALFESILMERVQKRINNLMAEAFCRNFNSKVDALLQQL